MDKNISMHISDRGHMNLTLNIYHCGNTDIREPVVKQTDYYMLYYVHEGNGTISGNGICHSLKPGYVFGVFPNGERTIKAEYGSCINVTWIAFSGYMVEHYLARGGITPLSPVAAAGSDGILEELFCKVLNDARILPNRYCKISASLYSIFAYLLDHCYPEQPPSVYTPEYYLLKALDFIDIYYNDSITVEQIAGSIGVTRKYLYSVFKELTAIAPKEYITYYRMEKAANLLQEQELTIGSIAVSVGYANQFCFAKEFKKMVGKTPTEYRAAVRQNPSDGYISPINKIKKEYGNVQTVPEQKHIEKGQ